MYPLVFFIQNVARLEKDGLPKANCDLPVDGHKVRVRAGETVSPDKSRHSHQSRASTRSSELVSICFIVPTPQPSTCVMNNLDK